MRTNKTVIRNILAVSAVLVGLGGACFAAEEAKPESTQAAAVPKVVEFDPSTYKGETGKIALPYEGEGNVLLSTTVDGKAGDYLVLASKSGVFVAPVGKYIVLSCAVKYDKGGQTWIVSPDVFGANIAVKVGETIGIGEGSRLLPLIKAGNMGKIVAPGYSDISVSLRTDDKNKRGDILRVSGKGKSVLAPCGVYEVSGCGGSKTDKAGVKWTLDVNSVPGKASTTIEVKPDSETQVQINDSFTASVVVDQSDDRVTMNYKLTNANGESCSIRSMDPQAEAPGFKVLDKSGKVLMSGKFQYG